MFRFLFLFLGILSYYSIKIALEGISGPRQVLRLTMLDVGQGDAIDIELPSKKHWLIDAGARTNSFDTGERVILPFYKRGGISELDAVILTHPDNDHIGGTASLINAIKVNHVYMSQKSDGSPDMKRIDSSLSIQHKQVEYVSCRDTLAVEPGVRVYVLHPEKVRAGQIEPKSVLSSNNQSLVFMIVYGKTKFLFTGDVGKEGEDQIMQSFGDHLQADVLKVAHHGSSNCSTSGFLIGVQPHVALISCGKLNKYNHPSDVILSRLSLLHAQIHRSDREGAVILESDGYSVRTIHWK